MRQGLSPSHLSRRRSLWPEPCHLLFHFFNSPTLAMGRAGATRRVISPVRLDHASFVRCVATERAVNFEPLLFRV
jgi:hypothetical protein